MSKPYFDLHSRRWYTIYKPAERSKWDGEHPLQAAAYREYVDGKP